MAYADYQHCVICDCKTFYDAGVDYDFNTGDVASLCKNCNETYQFVIMKKADITDDILEKVASYNE